MKIHTFHGLRIQRVGILVIMKEEIIINRSTLPIFKPRIAFRVISRTTDQRTIISCLLPPKSPIVSTSPYLFIKGGNEFIEASILGILSSIPFDWIARRILESNVSFFLLESLPIPNLEYNTTVLNELAIISGRLAAIDNRYNNWAQKLGVKTNSIKTKEEKNDLIYRIDALVAFLYGLNEDDIRVIFETFHAGWDFTPRLNAVLSHFRSIK